MTYVHPAISEPYARAIASTYREIFIAIVDHGDIRLGELETVSENDRRIMLSWNPSNPFASETYGCMHQLVETKARDIPNAEAICSWDGSLTYADLNAHANVAARMLIQVGIGPGVYVPFAFEKSMWAVVATLAILKAGGAFVPVNPSDPGPRLAEILSQVSADVVVTMQKFVPIFSSLAKTVIVISDKISGSDEWDERDPHRELNNEETHSIETRHVRYWNNSSPSKIKDGRTVRELSPSDPMVVLFTSGSTGQPKGMILEHSAICTHAIVHGSKMRYHGARVLQFAAHTFDVAIIDFFTTLLYGGCICIPSEEERKSDIVGFINRIGVDYAILTPSFAGLIDPSEIPTMKTLAIGGEALPQDRVQRWASELNLIQIYGPAEVGICLTMDMKLDTAPETVGYPLCNSSCWLVDPDNHNVLVPIGAIGELMVAGPSLARGYLNNKAKTHTSFTEKPAWAVRLGLECERFYLTGDLLRYNTTSFDGSYDIIGRKDAQIKFRGQRIEPAEIEYHIGKIPGVAVSMVTQPEKGYFAEQLVCVVQMHRADSKSSQVRNEPIHLSESQALTTRSLRGRLAKVLPTYMIPSTCLAVESMPLVPSLKIDRRQVNAWLVALKGDPGLNYMTQISPLLPCELKAMTLSRKISTIIAAKDEMRRSTLAGNDFSLQSVGIDSIQIISLSMYLQREHSVKIAMDTLLSPDLTIRALARLIDEHNPRKIDLLNGDLNAEVPLGIASTHVDMAHEIHTLEEELVDNLQPHLRKYNVLRGSTIHSKRNIFLTGVTGYLGSTILQRLLANPHVTLYALVRCLSQKAGMERIIAAAESYKWWHPSYTSRIHVWPGDLASPGLGLDPHNLRLLQGSAADIPHDSAIHTIIHNGAHVHYSSSYATLFPTNVNSTLELLRSTAQSPHISTLVFVSGGLKPDISFPTPPSTHEIKLLHEAGGYAQTKYVSDALVRNSVSHPAFQGKTLQLVRPGYIMGSLSSGGVANTSDFIWRLVAGCVEIGAFNVEEEDKWLFIADVEEVADEVLAGVCCGDDDDGDAAGDAGYTTTTTASSSFSSSFSSSSSSSSSSGHIRRILSGLLFSDLWSLLQDRFGYRLQGISYNEWIFRLKTKITEKRDEHLLFPLLHVLERDGSCIGGEKSLPMGKGQVQQEPDKGRVIRAVEQNVRFLIQAGFLPKQNEEEL